MRQHTIHQLASYGRTVRAEEEEEEEVDARVRVIAELMERVMTAMRGARGALAVCGAVGIVLGTYRGLATSTTGATKAGIAVAGASVWCEA